MIPEMLSVQSNRNRHFVATIFFRLFSICYIAAIVNCQYEEEPVQPNRIDEASSNFICRDEGYFADVTYGCQFYHVCENANSPYDKPTFVKHTFSCVNGTVFNQMSFTCTRYQDSIPCDASPNYFYLNKRNGDPKAYFLTDEDIIGHGNGGFASKQSSVDSELPMFRQSSSAVNQPVVAVPQQSQSSASAFSSAQFTRPSSQPAKQATVDHANESRFNYDSLISKNNYRTVTDESRTSSPLFDRTEYNRKASAPYEITSPFAINNNKKIKSSVRYSNMKSQSKYEPVKQNYQYLDSPSPSNLNDIRTQSNSLSIEGPEGESIGKPQYQSSMINIYKPTTQRENSVSIEENEENEKSDQSINFDHSNNNGQEAIRSPIRIISQPKKLPFTPAAFSKLYMESQRAAKYGHDGVRSSISDSYPASSSSSSSLSSSSTTPNQGISFDKDLPFERPNLYDLSYPKPQSINTQTKPIMFSSYTSDVGQSQEQPDTISKFESSPLSNLPHSSSYDEVKTNQYVVPSSVKIIKPSEIVNQHVYHNNNQNSNHNHPHPPHHQHQHQKQRQKHLQYHQQQQHHQQQQSQQLPQQEQEQQLPQQQQQNQRQHQHQLRLQSQYHSNNNRGTELSAQLLKHQSSNVEPTANEPVKISFVNKASNNPNALGGTDFSNLRVVKRIKGKSLLIDPSLENDPARDNIIAQVLEMLNKYNR